MDVLEWFGSGVLAGLALAVPLGAVGVLLLREGSLYGTRLALPAASAVATVDTVYCVLAVSLGAAAAPALLRLAPWPSVVAGLVLLALAAVGVVKGLREQVDPLQGADRTTGRRWMTFLLLTGFNPATLLYFVAVTTGLADLGSDPVSAVAFVIGVGLSSWGWQSLLVVAGGVLGRFSTQRVRRITGLVGSALVGILGVAVVVSAVHSG